MKLFAIALCLALFAVAQCQDDANAAPLTRDEVLDIIKESNPDIQCINLECRTDCQSNGFRAGFCRAIGGCTCVGPLIAG